MTSALILKYRAACIVYNRRPSMVFLKPGAEPAPAGIDYTMRRTRWTGAEEIV